MFRKNSLLCENVLLLSLYYHFFLLNVSFSQASQFFIWFFFLQYSKANGKENDFFCVCVCFLLSPRYQNYIPAMLRLSCSTQRLGKGSSNISWPTWTFPTYAFFMGSQGERKYDSVNIHYVSMLLSLIICWIQLRILLYVLALWKK